MATLVRHKPTGKHYVLVGAGFVGADRAGRRGLVGKVLGGGGKPDDVGMVAVCDRAGNICWADSDALAVVEIDGRHPAEIIPS